jgi:threonine/homoserine/homoserine lactone efflux protein
MSSDTLLTYALSGMIFGLTAGVSPGPLLTLVISETLGHGRKAGILIALAPLISDIPVILVALIFFISISGLQIVTGSISILGALFVGYLAYENLTLRRAEFTAQEVQSHSLRKGILTNILNPQPLIFWCTVGAPTIMKACESSIVSAVCFMSGFYGCLVGSKIVVAFIIDRSRAFLNSRIYVYSMRILGIFLLLFAFLFLWEGFKALGLLS